VRGRADGLQLPGRAPVAALAGCGEREVVGTSAGGRTVDVHSRRYQRRDQVRALRGGAGCERRSEREPGDIGLSGESVPEEIQERHGVACHLFQADAGPVLPFPQRAAAAALVPVDDREGLFQAEEVLEAARFADHRQAGTLLDQQEHRVGSARPANPDPLGGAAGLDCLQRIDRHLGARHGYALASVGAWPVAWARRPAAPGSWAGRITRPG
jgi:hypothetical protein